MRFRLIDQAKKEFPVHRLCNVLGVSEGGYFAWKGRPASHRQSEDIVLLAHIRARFSTSNQTYGAPRMHAELKEEGFAVGRHRVARLMRDNGLNRDSPYEILPTQKVCLGSVSHAISLHLTVARSVIRSKKDQLAAIRC